MLNEDITSQALCVSHLLDLGLCLAYAVLLVECGKLIAKHQSSIAHGLSSGLSCFLICSSILCIFRLISFFLLLSQDRNCSYLYLSDSYQDAILIFHNTLPGWQQANVVLSTIALTLYYTSYSNFLYSLTKVLDLLTTNSSSSTATSFVAKFCFNFLNFNQLSVFLVFVTSLWLSTLLVLLGVILHSDYLYVFAKIGISLASLVMDGFVLIALAKVWYFMHTYVHFLVDFNTQLTDYILLL